MFGASSRLTVGAQPHYHPPHPQTHISATNLGPSQALEQRPWLEELCFAVGDAAELAAGLAQGIHGLSRSLRQDPFSRGTLNGF